VALETTVDDRHGDGPLLQARGISKAYGHVQALRDIDLDLWAGEVLGLVGDNGAGKSTLVKILSGATQPDAGTIVVDGRAVHIRSPGTARRYGIETVYQDLAVVPRMDVAENLFLGREERLPGPPGLMLRLINRRGMRNETSTRLRDLQISIASARQRLETLSGGQRQAVAVARAIIFGRRIVIMDEPTAALGVVETRSVLDLVRRVSKSGCSVIFISHDMPHVFEISHRIMVLRHGRRAGVLRTRDTSLEQIIRLMTGGEVLNPEGDGPIS
jgi:fructose transport system ATP-binding protein